MRCRDCERYGADHFTGLCSDCHRERIELEEPIVYRRRLTRQEQLEALADQGIDTLEEYNDYYGDDL